MNNECAIPFVFAVAGLYGVPLLLMHGLWSSAAGFGVLSALGWLLLWMTYRESK